MAVVEREREKKDTIPGIKVLPQTEHTQKFILHRLRGKKEKGMYLQKMRFLFLTLFIVYGNIYIMLLLRGGNEMGARGGTFTAGCMKDKCIHYSEKMRK